MKRVPKHIIDVLRRRWEIVILLIMAFMLPPLIRSIYLLSLLSYILMYAVAAESCNIIVGYTGYLNLGHAAFFGVGAYTTALLVHYLHVPPFLTLPISGLAAAALALLVGLVSLRLSAFYFACFTISLSSVLMTLIIEQPWAGGAIGVTIPSLPLSPYVTEVIFYWTFLIICSGTVLFVYTLSRSKLALGLLTIREDESTCPALGINAANLKIKAFLLSAFPMGVVGGVYALRMGYIDPPTVFSFIFSIYSTSLVAFGGGGTVIGPVIAAFIMMPLSEMLRYYITWGTQGFHIVIFSVIVIMTMMFMPEGIIGWLKEKFPRCGLA